jgi:hypothetical protein
MDRKYIGLGIALGVVFGVATDHLGLGLALGIVFGTAIAAAKGRRDGRSRKK